MTEDLAFTAGVIIGSLVMGTLIGLIPLICGIVKHRIGLALGGFAACIGGSFILGLFLSIPMCVLFTILICVRRGSAPDRNGGASGPQPGPSAGYVPRNDSIQRCARCGAILSPGLAFCPHCGTAAGRPGANRCPACGGENPADACFCTRCGARLR